MRPAKIAFVPPAAGKFPNMDDIAPARAAELVDAGQAVLVDVRSDDEWAAGHAPQARHMPITALAPEQLRSAPLVLTTCRSGGRATKAAEALAAAGLPVSTVAGGMRGWAQAGLAVKRDDGSPGTID